MTDRSILKIKTLSRFYPGVRTINRLLMESRGGKVHALLGGDETGKSTLIKCVTGAIRPDEEVIEIDGEEFTSPTPRLAKDKGVEVIHQEFSLTPQMAYAGNVYLDEYTSGLIVNTKKHAKRAKEISDDLGVDANPNRPVGSYTPVYIQIVEITKAISRNVRILIMDEPTTPLAVNEVELLFKIVRRSKERGVTILYISHRIGELFEIGDRVSIMRDGEYIKTLNIAETDRQEPINLAVGRKLTESYPGRKVEIGEEVLRVENLAGNDVRDISFTLRRGEILGFGGLIGVGHTELMNVTYGANRLEDGRTYLDGKPTRVKDTCGALKKGIGPVPGNRKRTGLFLKVGIRWNCIISTLKSISHLGVVGQKKEKEIANNYTERLNIRTRSSNQFVGNLSDGNQQRVVLIKTMATDMHILISDRPIKGVNVGVKQEIYQLMNQLVEEGCLIMTVSSDIPELLGMSDRVVVISEDRQAGVILREEFSQAYVLNLASGNN